MTLSGRLKHVFLDMDGTIYQGDSVFPCTKPFLARLKSLGIGWTFLTNNSSFTPEEYARKLTGMGIESKPEDFFVSTDHTILWLKRNRPDIRSLYVLCVPAVGQLFVNAGFRLTDGQERPDAVIAAFDKTLDYEKLCRACWWLSKGIPGFATHPDNFCPTDRETYLPDCGAITALLETATGKKLHRLGKPDPGMLIMAAEKYGLRPEECLMCGDRLATDIAVGVNAGTLTCHIADPDGIYPETPKPDFRVRDLSGLLSHL